MMTNEQSTTPQPSKNLRPCPAIKGYIKPSDCGSQRGSKLACPAECPFFPLGIAAYDLLLKTEQGGLKKASRFVFDHVPRSQLDRLYREGSSVYAGQAQAEILATGYLLWSMLSYYRGSDGKTLLELWESKNWVGLNNDERLWMQCRQRWIMTVVEVQKIRQPHMLVCQDLLRPEAGELIINDREFALTTARFSRILCYLVPLPHYHRVSPTVFMIPMAIWPEWKTSILQRFESCRGTAPDLSMSVFLAQNLADCVHLLHEISIRIKNQILEQLDLKACIASYRLRIPANDFEAMLRNRPDFQPSQPPSLKSGARLKACFDWITLGESAVLRQQNAVVSGKLDPEKEKERVGTLWLTETHLGFQAFRHKKFVQARQWLEKQFADQLQLEKETVQNLGEERALQEEANAEVSRIAQLLEVPSEIQEETAPLPDDHMVERSESGEEQRQKSRAEHEQRYASFLDQPNAELDQATPRVASLDAALRPRLRELMKTHIHQVELRNRQEGLDLDLDWVLDALRMEDMKA